MPNGAAWFEVACCHCAMRFVVDRIRDAEIRAMSDHLRSWHSGLRLSAMAALGEVLDHYRVAWTPSNLAAAG